MKLESVENLLKLADEYAVLRGCFWSNNEEARSMIAVFVQAADANVERDAQRASDVQEMLDASDVSEAARRMYGRELSGLRSKVYGASAADAADFEALMSEMQEQEVAMRRLREKIKAAIRDVEADVADIRAKTVGDSSAISYTNWIEGLKKSFQSKCMHYSKEA